MLTIRNTPLRGVREAVLSGIVCRRPLRHTLKRLYQWEVRPSPSRHEGAASPKEEKHIMDRRKLIALAGAASALLALTGCQKEARAPTPAKPLPVTTHVAHATNEPHWIEILGQAEGGREVEVRAQVSGLLQSIEYQEGDLVEAGDVLFRIDPQSFRAKYEAARAQREEAASNLEQAERELKRNDALLKSGAVAQKTYDDALSLRNQMRHALATAKANEHDAKINLDWTEVRAPATGYAERAQVNPGALITSATTLLTTVTQHDDVRVTFAPSDRDLAGATVTTANPVRLFRKDGTELQAKLDYVAQSITADLGSRTMRARVQEGAALLPGEFVKVRLQTFVEEGVFRVPQKAVLQRPDGTYALYLVRDGKARAQTVTVGLWEGVDWIIRSGLREGDVVITNQLVRLRDGAAVTTEDEAANADASQADAG